MPQSPTSPQAEDLCLRVSCPSPEHLATLLDEQLPELERERLEVHLSDCPDCQRRLLDLSMAPAERERLGQVLQSIEVETEVPADLLTQLKAAPYVLPDESPPPEIPGFVIEGELGRGGMAVVYRARQLGLKRPVALKMILVGQHASREVRDRFLREATAVARLQHPNIVQIYEIGEHDSLPFFSMELVEGGTLRQALQNASLAPLQAVVVTRRLRAALPRHSPTATYQGLTLLRTGSLRDARDTLETALKTQHDTKLAAFSAAALSLAHLYAGDLELAQPFLNQADAWLTDQAGRLPAEGTVAEVSWEWQLWLEVQLLRWEATKLEQELRKQAGGPIGVEQ